MKIRRRVALAALVLSCGCPARIHETRRLDFDETTSAGRLLSGWSRWETTPAPESATFVWADLRESTIRIDSPGGDGRLVRFRAWPFWYPAAPPQSVKVTLNGAAVEEVRMEAGPHVYEVWAPADLWRRGANEIRFTFAYAEAPRDKNPPSDDARTLAAAFDYVEILPARKRAPFSP